ncbi:MAG: AMP-binding protein [Rhodanobacteraceae bacterium]
MSAVIGIDLAPHARATLPLLACGNRSQVVAWRDGRGIDSAEFLADVAQVAALLPDLTHAVNLCEDRYAFLVAFCAVICRGQTNLLPPSRAPQAIDEALAAHPASYALSDGACTTGANPSICLPALGSEGSPAFAGMPTVAVGQVAAIGFTSGSTGLPKANPKTWGQFQVSSANNVELLGRSLGLDHGAIANIVATVPPQHMYGLEMSVLLPLTGPFSVHAGRPLFAADIAAALEEVPMPRLLVTTPVHLGALLRSEMALPPIGAIVTATAPLPVALARATEDRYATSVVELFGSTETCVIAHRRPAEEDAWHLYHGITLKPQPDGTLVSASHLPSSVALQDVVELLRGRHFRLRGRNSDLLEIAGKRASLGDLTRRLLALPGVLDAAVFQSGETDRAGVRRIAALVVAPGRTARDLMTDLRRVIDPVFLPRPLRRVACLPRNETGKLPLAALHAALGSAPREPGNSH